MLRSHRFACISAGLTAAWLMVAACSEAGTVTAPLPDGISPTQSPFPSRPNRSNRDLLMLPGALNPAYQLDDNGVIPNGVSQGDAETPIDQGLAGTQVASDAGPAAEPAPSAPSPDNAAQTPTETPPETTPPETTTPEEPPVDEPSSEPPANEGDEFNDPTPITPSAGCDLGDPEPPHGMASLMIR